MAEELKAEKTNVSVQEIAIEMTLAYWRYFRSWPKKNTIKILLAQWALETGWGKHMWCYNIGNAKSREGDGHDYCFFACNEILSEHASRALQAEDPERVKITSTRSNGTCIVWFYPKHPWCRFRAFRSLSEGVYDHLKMVVRTFDKAWPHAVDGDPRAYSRALKLQKYYTADEASYTKTLVAVFNKLDSLEVPLGPIIPEEERQRVMNSVALSLQDMVEDIHEREQDSGADPSV